MDNIKILIVEDEILIAEDLKDDLESFGINQIKMAHDVDEALQQIRLGNPDLVLLDIRLEKGKEGLDIGRYLKNEKLIPFIYITAHSDMSLINEMVETKPSAYITKPFKKSDLFAAIGLAQETIKKNTLNNISIKDGYNTVRIQQDDIFFIESDGNYIILHTKSKKYMLRKSLDSIMKDLDDTRFIKIHRSYIVNKNHVRRYSSKSLKINMQEIPISRTYSIDFKSFMEG